jgi:mediator of RNA polymerase II transcription subunit 5
LDELKQQFQAGSGDLALDIAATIICAPMAESFGVDQNSYHPVNSTKESHPRCAILTLRDALVLQHENVPKISEKDPLRAEMIVRLSRRVNVLMAPPSQVSNIDVSNIINNMHIGIEGQERMDLKPTAAGVGDNGVGGDEDQENISKMLDKAAATATAVGIEGGVGVGQDMGLDAGDVGMDAIDDVLNAADMAVGNPEFLDLDMEGMF